MKQRDKERNKTFSTRLGWQVDILTTSSGKHIARTCHLRSSEVKAKNGTY
jgi:hypothetical protein